MDHLYAIMAVFYCMNKSNEVFADIGHQEWLWSLVDSNFKSTVFYKLSDNVKLILIRVVNDLIEFEHILMILKLCEANTQSYHFSENNDLIVYEVVWLFLIKIYPSTMLFLVNYFHSIFLTIDFTDAPVYL